MEIKYNLTIILSKSIMTPPNNRVNVQEELDERHQELNQRRRRFEEERQRIVIYDEFLRLSADMLRKVVTIHAGQDENDPAIVAQRAIYSEARQAFEAFAHEHDIRIV